jgi:sigma-E factor negative regulatory protein RseA
MHKEEVNEKISRLIDADLNYNETLALLKQVQSDDALKAKMCRYQAISEALKTDQFYQVKSDFSNQIFQALQQEPTYLLPSFKPQQHLPSPSKYSNRNKLFAVAASSVAAAILVGYNIFNDKQINGPQNLAKISTYPAQLVATNSKPDKSKPDRQPLNAQFNDYLQAHNNSVYTNGEANFQPYAKVTSYDQR